MTTLDRTQAAAPPRLSFKDYCREQQSFADAALAGLRRKQKAIPCPFLYDERGSALFDKICGLREYYPTRTETAILKANAEEIAEYCGAHASLIELGSGSSVKTRILLDALEAPACYAPIDVSREHLRNAAAKIARDYPQLKVEAICADYADAFPLPEAGRRTVVFFPGSTIGNLNRDDARTLLASWRDRLDDEGMMVIGIDLKKDPRVLEAAYNDAAGVTEAFIRNIFVRANRELGADFDLEAFEYEARYEPGPGRVEMYLTSREGQTVTLCGAPIRFAEGERVHIENSHKYSLDEASALGEAAGFSPLACYTDDAQRFSVHVWSAS
ncbi:MAG: L-histidine N(alpha)-methyltransferase [Hyphomonadaceae bacterium]